VSRLRLGRAVNMLPYRLSSYSTAFAAPPYTPYTVTLTVFASDGKIADTRS
jgi:hypothetical protein